MTGWIDTKLQIPPRDIWVLGWCWRENLPIIFCVESWADERDIADMVSKVSHWHVLPKGPGK